MATGPGQLPVGFLFEMAAVRDLRLAVPHHHVVNGFVVGVLHVPLLEELEMHASDLEAVPAVQDRRDSRRRAEPSAALGELPGSGLES